MANKKFTELQTASTITGTDQIAIIQSGVSKNITQKKFLSKIGGGSDYITFDETTGEMGWNGNTRFYKADFMPATSASVAGVSDPPFQQLLDDGAGSVGIFTYVFEPKALQAQEQEIFFIYHVPNGYAEGTDIIMHLHWSPMDDQAGEVVWGVESEWTNFNDTFTDTFFGTVVSPTAEIAKRHQENDFPDLVGTGKTPHSIIACRLFRNSSNVLDTYPGNAAFLSLTIQTLNDKLGVVVPIT